MHRDERRAVRALSLAVHDSVLAAPPDLDAPPLAELKATLAHAWDRFWQGDYTGTCMLVRKVAQLLSVPLSQE